MRAYRLTPLKILLLAAAAFYLIFILRTSFSTHGQLYFTLVDDAMVSMRYAHHLAQGYGLVWNVGDKPVEGFTNPSWTLLMALLHLLPLPVSKVSLLVMILSAAVLLANALVVYKLCQRLAPDSRYAPWIAAAITAFYFPMVFWSLRGMEVGALALLIDLSALVALRLNRAAPLGTTILLALLLGLALFTRLDSALQVGLIIAYVFSTGRVRLGKAVMLATAALLVIAGILWWQHSYFGDFLPNTYYEKIVGTSAVVRIKNGLLVFNQYASRDTLMLTLIAAAGILVYRGMRTREVALLAALFAVQCVYSVWVGGDYAEPEVAAANRFITQGMTLIIILFSLTIDRVISDVALMRKPALALAPRAQAAISSGVACAALLVISGQPWINWAIDNAPLLKADIRRVKVGLAIAQYTSPDATIAVHAAGQIPYYSDRRTVDLLGLNDPVIAKGPITGPFYPGHDKWNYDYSIMQLRPDLIADNWIKLGDYMKDKTDYQQLDNGMYVRKDTTLLDVAGLSQPIR